MKITTVTVTGADDTVKHEDLIRISEEYPHVEFAILLSRKYLPDGTSRFPSAKWLKELVKLPPHVKLAAHICGQWVKEIYQGTWPIEEVQQATGISDVFDRFERWQLNTHGRTYKWTPHFLQSLAKGPIQTIFQYDGKNSEVVYEASIREYSVAALFDLSHGTGVLPSEWPTPIERVYCGYAGGLSPENVKSQCEKLSTIVKGLTWIDAETHLRSTALDSHYDYFDLQKVKNFLANSKEFV